MENLDVTVLRTLHGWRNQGQRALLATVVRTWGSSPRPIGSIMALCESGAVVGLGLGRLHRRRPDLPLQPRQPDRRQRQRGGHHARDPR